MEYFIKITSFSVLRLLCLLCLLAITYSSRAQGYAEGVNLSGDFMPLILGDGGRQYFNGLTYKLTDNVPVYLKKDKSEYVLLGLNLETMRFPGTHNLFPVDAVYGISPLMGYGKNLTKKINLSVLLIPLLNSDMKVVSSDDYHFGSVVRGVYQVRQNVSFRATLGYRRQYYGTQYIVFLGGDWKINSHWRLFGDLPNNATLAYTINPKMKTGIIYLAGNTTYHLSLQHSYLLYDYAQAGVFLEYYLTKYLALRGTVTNSLIRKLDIFSSGQQVSGGVIDYIPMSAAPQPWNAFSEVTNGPAFRLSLSLRVQ